MANATRWMSSQAAIASGDQANFTWNVQQKSSKPMDKRQVEAVLNSRLRRDQQKDRLLISRTTSISVHSGTILEGRWSVQQILLNRVQIRSNRWETCFQALLGLPIDCQFGHSSKDCKQGLIIELFVHSPKVLEVRTVQLFFRKTFQWKCSRKCFRTVLPVDFPILWRLRFSSIVNWK